MVWEVPSRWDVFQEVAVWQRVGTQRHKAPHPCLQHSLQGSAVNSCNGHHFCINTVTHQHAATVFKTYALHYHNNLNPKQIHAACFLCQNILESIRSSLRISRGSALPWDLEWFIPQCRSSLVSWISGRQQPNVHVLHLNPVTTHLTEHCPTKFKAVSLQHKNQWQTAYKIL